MRKHMRTLAILCGMASIIGQPSVFAKSSYQLDKEANKLEKHAANKEIKAVAEQNESSTAIDEGKKDTAAEHARKAAREQGIANQYEKKAKKIEGKAAEKAVRESY